MTEIETRLAANFPALRMMMISLIVALSYEKLIESYQRAEGLWTASPENLLLWSQFLFMTAAPLEYWFTMSLSSSSVRTVFRPRDALGPLMPALAFFVLASNIGIWDPAIWSFVLAALFGIAWYAIRDQGRRYTFDSLLAGDVTSHRLSSRMMLACGILIVGAGLGLRGDSIGPGLAGSCLVVGLLGSIAGHAVWYGEWKRVTRLDERGVEPAARAHS